MLRGQRRIITRSQRIPFQQVQPTSDMPCVTQKHGQREAESKPTTNQPSNLASSQDLENVDIPLESLKRPRSTDQEQEQEQEQPALSRKAPRIDIKSMATSSRSSSSLAKMPSVFTPINTRPAIKPKKRHVGAANKIQNYFAPLKPKAKTQEDPVAEPLSTQEADAPIDLPLPEATPARQPSEPPLNTPLTVNPFLLHPRDPSQEPVDTNSNDAPPTSATEPETGAPPSTGDKFGPAVQSLAAFITEADKDRPNSIVAEAAFQDSPQLNASHNPLDMDVDANPSPCKPVLSMAKTTLKASMIPRLALARPPRPTVEPPKPTEPSQQELKPPPQSRPSAPTSTASSSSTSSASSTENSQRRTTLSTEAQASLANLSMALEQLSIPRPRTSLGGPLSLASSSTLTLGRRSAAMKSSRASIHDENSEERHPPRPSTSLGFASGASKSRARLSISGASGSRSNHGMGSISSTLAGPNKAPIKAPLGRSVPASDTLKAKGSQSNNSFGSAATTLLSGDTSMTSDSMSTVSSAPSVYTTPVETESECLKGYVIFVDVRTDEGADAGAMFVTSFRKLGAKVLARWSPSCTHIVWKAGMQSTLSKFRLHTAEQESLAKTTKGRSTGSTEQFTGGEHEEKEAPKKMWLMGIGWAVKCVEKKEKIPEALYQLDLSQEEIVFGSKRRRSHAAKDRSSLTSGLGSSFLQPKSNIASSSKLPINPSVIRSASATHRSTLSKPLGRQNALVNPTASSSSTKKGRMPPGAATVSSRPTNAAAMFANRARDRKVPRLKPLIAPPTPVREDPEMDVDGFGEMPARPSSSSSTAVSDGESKKLISEVDDAFDRARKSTMKYAPKVSSPLKRNFRIFDDDYQSD